MGTVVPATAVQDSPEPTMYRGQHMLDLPVDDDAWLRFSGGSATGWPRPSTLGRLECARWSSGGYPG